MEEMVLILIDYFYIQKLGKGGILKGMKAKGSKSSWTLR